MKKFFLFIMMLVMAFSIVGCNKEVDDNNNDRKVTLTYASWGDATLEQAMIDAFVAEHPNITVLRDTTISGTGNAFTANLIAAAQAGTLPDVFVTDNVPNVIKAGLTYDVASLWDKDDDAKLVYPNIAQTAFYNGKRLAVPSYQFIKGMLVNLTLLDDLSGDPGTDWTWDEFKSIVSTYSNTPLSGKTIYGINGLGRTDRRQGRRIQLLFLPGSIVQPTCFGRKDRFPYGI
jgi:multiple sugar transport system substrate-binding protein